jgi:two-component system sensor histidine kinase and response regulator WspE
VNDPKWNDFGSSLLDLYRLEAENQTTILTAGLLELERNPNATSSMEKLLRAAHSLKGAARIVNLQPAIRVAHAMEDCLVAAQSGNITLGRAEIDLLFRGIDLLQQSSKSAEEPHAVQEAAHAKAVQEYVEHLQGFLTQAGEASARPARARLQSESLQPAALEKSPAPVSGRKRELSERVLRLTAENLNHLLGLAGESLVEARWLQPFSDSMQRLRHLQSEAAHSLQVLRGAVESPARLEHAKDSLEETSKRLVECQQFLSEKLEELELFDRRSAHLSHRLYLEVLRARMQPFGDSLRRFPRMVRDLARSLGKEVRLEMIGENTQVDRDILERLEAPLAHLLRNAVDHGCEPPAERTHAGKPPEGRILLESHHSAGMLVVSVSDDGPGIDLNRLRQLIVEKRFATAPVAEQLAETELLEFLFLPGFTMKEFVTEISGRGVGLDVVQHMVKSVRGTVRVSMQQGRGTRFQLQLPLTLSVLRTLLVNIGGEPYALPLSQISRALRLPLDKVLTIEGRWYFTLEPQQQIGLLAAHQVMDCEAQPLGDELSVVVLGHRNRRYGLIVDRFLGERELVVQPLDPRLGRVKDISAAALMEDGSPVLIIDIEDILDSMETLISSGLPNQAVPEPPGPGARRRKRILAVDDSLAVRELERKLLTARGYLADVAVDGMDAWNAVRTGHYDLVITDVDMPRMDGIELAARIKKDPSLKSLPIIVVSYKERDEDRLRGYEAGVDHYLTKGSFHDETLLQAVMDLIGNAES